MRSPDGDRLIPARPATPAGVLVARAILPGMLILGAMSAWGCVAIPFEDPRAEGGGQGSVILAPSSVQAADSTTLTFTYVVGGDGIVQGGGFRVRLPVDPVHEALGCTPPHHRRWFESGYVACRCGDEEISPRQVSARTRVEFGVDGEVRCLLATGRLAPGEQLVMTYEGHMPRVAGAWRLPVESRRSGGRGGLPLPVGPVLNVLPGPARVFHTVLPSQALPEEPLLLHVAALDEFGNLDTEYRGRVRVRFDEEERTVAFDAQARGILRTRVVPHRPGHAWAEVEETGDEPLPLNGRSNPVRVLARDAPRPAWRILWGDPHAHTGPGESGGRHGFLPAAPREGDGRGEMTSPGPALDYARDVMRLDFAALPLYAGSALTDEARARTGVATARYDGSLVPFGALHALEWRDRLILLEREPDRCPDEDRRDGDDLPELRDALAGTGALEFAIRGSAPDPGTAGWEVYSWANRGEGYEDDEGRFEPVEPWVAALGDGEGPVTAIAGTDNHWGRPGARARSGLEPGAGGLTAVLAAGPAPAEILAALQRGRAWATTGARILLLVDPPPPGARTAHIETAGEALLARVDLILLAPGESRAVPLLEDSAWNLTGDVEIPEVRERGFWFVRTIQRDGETAWSSLYPTGP